MNLADLTPLQQMKRYRLSYIMDNLVNDYDPAKVNHTNNLKRLWEGFIDTRNDTRSRNSIMFTFDTMIFDEELEHAIERAIHFLSGSFADLAKCGVESSIIMQTINTLHTVPHMTHDMSVHNMVCNIITDTIMDSTGNGY
jgi:hypothetical protein